MNKNDICELGTALSNINDLNTKIFLLQAQVDTQAGELKRHKEERESTVQNEKAFIMQIEKIKEACKTSGLEVVGTVKSKVDSIKASGVEVVGSMKSTVDGMSDNVKNGYQASLEKLTILINEMIAGFKSQIERIKAMKISREKEDGEEDKEKELSTLQKKYQDFLEKVTEILNGIITQFNDQVKKVKDKSTDMCTSIVEKKNAGIENFNNKLREFFEKLMSATIDNVKHICKDRGVKDNALDTTETEEKVEEESKPDEKQIDDSADSSEQEVEQIDKTEGEKEEKNVPEEKGTCQEIAESVAKEQVEIENTSEVKKTSVEEETCEGAVFDTNDQAAETTETEQKSEEAKKPGEGKSEISI